MNFLSTYLTLLQQLFVFLPWNHWLLVEIAIFLNTEQGPLPVPLLCIGQYMDINLKLMLDKGDEGAGILVYSFMKLVISPPKTSPLCMSSAIPQPFHYTTYSTILNNFSTCLYKLSLHEVGGLFYLFSYLWA